MTRIQIKFNDTTIIVCGWQDLKDIVTDAIIIEGAKRVILEVLDE